MIPKAISSIIIFATLTRKKGDFWGFFVQKRSILVFQCQNVFIKIFNTTRTIVTNVA